MDLYKYVPHILGIGTFVCYIIPEEFQSSCALITLGIGIYCCFYDD